MLIPQSFRRQRSKKISDFESFRVLCIVSCGVTDRFLVLGAQLKIILVHT